jgi:hypothetical protein
MKPSPLSVVSKASRRGDRPAEERQVVGTDSREEQDRHSGPRRSNRSPTRTSLPTSRIHPHFPVLAAYIQHQYRPKPFSPSSGNQSGGLPPHPLRQQLPTDCRMGRDNHSHARRFMSRSVGVELVPRPWLRGSGSDIASCYTLYLRAALSPGTQALYFPKGGVTTKRIKQCTQLPK